MSFARSFLFAAGGVQGLGFRAWGLIWVAVEDLTKFSYYNLEILPFAIYPYHGDIFRTPSQQPGSYIGVGSTALQLTTKLKHP